MNVTLKTGSYEPVFTFTMRMSSAIDMLTLTEKLATGQEIEEAFDIMQNNMHDALPEINMYIEPRFFKGHHDVIFELHVQFEKTKDYVGDHEYYSEHIAGTILTIICNHFEWIGYDTPILDSTNIRHNDYKNLTALCRD